MRAGTRFSPLSQATAVAIGLLATGSSAPAWSQEPALEEVVVTARQRSESLQDVPVSVKAFTASEIEDAGISRAADFLQLTPNVTFASSESAGVNFMTIRGISQVRNGESPVAVVVDGVLMTDPGQFDQELFDIQQIEVLKGPQGALYGRNAIGGAINITTKQASDVMEGKVVVGAGNGSMKKIQGMLSGPVAEGMSFRISGSYVDEDGLIDNEYLNEEADPYEDTTVRGRFNWEVSDRLTVDLRGSYAETEGGALNFILQDNCGELNGCFSADRVFDRGAADDTSTPITAGRLGTNEREITSASLKVDYEAGFGTLTSITAWTDQEEFYAADAYPYDCGPACDFGELRIFDTAFGAIPLESTQLVKVLTEVETVSQEFRITSSDEGALRWIAGAYFLGTERKRGLPTELDVGQPYSRTVFNENTIFGFADDNDNTAYAVFGQVNYDVTDTIEASLAIRYDRDEREQTDIAPPPFSATTGLTRERTYSETQPKFTVKYQPSDDFNLFATWSKGFRSGGFNQNGVGAVASAAGIPGISDDYEKEVSENFEIGFKSSLAEDRLKINGAIFSTDVENQHFFQFIGAINAQLLNNIDEVALRGAELEVQYRVAAGLDLYAAYGYTDSEIEDYTVFPVDEGNWAPYVARDTINIGGQYVFPVTDALEGLFRLDYERRGEQYWDTANSTSRSPLDLVNMRAGVESISGGWSLMAWARNLTDEEYNAEYVIGGIAQIARPRTYGIEFTKRF